MFARTLELTVKAEKKPELIKTAKVEILPILDKQVGLVQIFAPEMSPENEVGSIRRSLLPYGTRRWMRSAMRETLSPRSKKLWSRSWLFRR